MTAFSIALLPGDGIGPEVADAADRVLSRVADRFGLRLEIQRGLIGGAAIDACGTALPQKTLTLCRHANAILLGAVGGPKWSDPDAAIRPEQGLLRLRHALGLFANIRPVKPFPACLDASPLKADRLRGTDLVIVRELTGGLYFGDKEEGEEKAEDQCAYRADEVVRVVRVAARLARARSGRLTSVDKANVLATSRLWRRVTGRLVAREFPDVTLNHMLVDAMAMHLITGPAAFDVIVTDNLFGDILSDEASVLAGSLGLLPSASLGAAGPGLFEPIHGSAPDIAGAGKANPFGMILSAAMLLRDGLGQTPAAEAVEAAVAACLEAGAVTADLGGPLTTECATEAVVGRLDGGRS